MKKNKLILIATIGRPRGLKGEFFLRSFAEKLETLISFKKFFSLQSFIMEEIFFEYIKKSNNNIIAKLKSIDDIEGIKSFGQKDIYVLKSELPELEKNEAYWFELEKMQVLNLEGQHLGNVDRVDNFGANDVLKVQKKNKTLLIPFIKNRVIISINKKENSILVDWQEDY